MCRKVASEISDESSKLLFCGILQKANLTQRAVNLPFSPSKGAGAPKKNSGLKKNNPNDDTRSNVQCLIESMRQAQTQNCN